MAHLQSECHINAEDLWGMSPGGVSLITLNTGAPIWPSSYFPIRPHRSRFITCDPVCPQTRYVFVDRHGVDLQSQTGGGGVSGHLCRTKREAGWIAAICLQESLFRAGPDVPSERLPSHHSSVGSPGLLSLSYVTVSPLSPLLCLPCFPSFYSPTFSSVPLFFSSFSPLLSFLSLAYIYSPFLSSPLISFISAPLPSLSYLFLSLLLISLLSPLCSPFPFLSPPLFLPFSLLPSPSPQPPSISLSLLSPFFFISSPPLCPLYSSPPSTDNKLSAVFGQTQSMLFSSLLFFLLPSSAVISLGHGGLTLMKFPQWSHWRIQRQRLLGDNIWGVAIWGHEKK